MTNVTHAAAAGITFCQDYVELAGDLAAIGKWFIVAALVFGIAFAVAELVSKLRTRDGVGTRGAPSLGTLKDLIDALKGFIEALAKAPAWLALFGIGLVLFWAVAESIPDGCKNEMRQNYVAD